MIHHACTNVLQQQRWRQCRCAGGARGWKCRLWRWWWCRQGCKCSISVPVAPLSRQPESSSAHAIVVSHFFIKMCQFITWYLSWMHGRVCFITTRKSLHCSSCKRYTSTSWTECPKDGNVSDVKERSPTTTHSPSHLLPSWPGTCNIISTECGMHALFEPQFSTKNQKLSFIPIRCAT